jgi:4-amino-4-deoxy-L-arabinose transferase-like glycosyltransferase
MQALDLGLLGVVAVQVAVAALATLALYDLGTRLASRGAGLLAGALFAVNPDLLQWHYYILTDSLYISGVVLAVWSIQTAAGSARRAQLAALLVVVAAALVRPNGWWLLPCALGYWALRAGRQRRLALALSLAALLAAVLAGASLPVGRNLVAWTAPDVALWRGDVIWGYPAWRQPMPPGPEAERSWLPLVEYIARYPLDVLRLAGLRVGVELSHVRPYYSARHNVLIVALLVPVYVLAICGIWSTWRAPLTGLLLAVILGHLAIVGATYADYDGRFLLYVLPLIGIFAGAGLAAWVKGARTRLRVQG